MLVDDNVETPEETEEREEEERKLEDLRESRAREERCTLQFRSMNLLNEFLLLLSNLLNCCLIPNALKLLTRFLHLFSSQAVGGAATSNKWTYWSIATSE